MTTSEAFDVDMKVDASGRNYALITLAGVEVYRSYQAAGLGLKDHQTVLAALSDFAHWLAKAVRDAEQGSSPAWNDNDVRMR